MKTIFTVYRCDKLTFSNPSPVNEVELQNFPTFVEAATFADQSNLL